MRLDNVMVAGDYTALTSGSLLAPINVTETGAPVADSLGVWTGTDQHGVAWFNDYDCFRWTCPYGPIPITGECRQWDPYKDGTSHIDFTALGGNPNSTTATWSNWGEFQCSSTLHLYCFQQ